MIAGDREMREAIQTAANARALAVELLSAPPAERVPTSAMRAKFGFRSRFRLNRSRRGFLPLRRALFHRRLRIWSAARVVRELEQRA